MQLEVLLQSLAATLLISLLPFLLLFLLVQCRQLCSKRSSSHSSFLPASVLRVAVAFAIGGLLGDALLHLFPHALHPHTVATHDHHHERHDVPSMTHTIDEMLLTEFKMEQQFRRVVETVKEMMDRAWQKLAVGGVLHAHAHEYHHDELEQGHDTQQLDPHSNDFLSSSNPNSNLAIHTDSHSHSHNHATDSHTNLHLSAQSAAQAAIESAKATLAKVQDQLQSINNDKVNGHSVFQQHKHEYSHGRHVHADHSHSHSHHHHHHTHNDHPHTDHHSHGHTHHSASHTDSLKSVNDQFTQSTHTPSHSHSHCHSHHHDDEHSHEQFTRVGLLVLLGMMVFFVIEKCARMKGNHSHHSHSYGSNSHVVRRHDTSKKMDVEDELSDEDTSILSAGMRKRIAKSSNTSQTPTKPKIKGRVSSSARLSASSVRRIDSDARHLTALLNLIADCTHNFTDGLAIAGSFSAGLHVGVSTTVAVLIHEIPHELGDLAILLQSGVEMKKALCFQLLTAIGALAGVVFAYLTDTYSHLIGIEESTLTAAILPFTAGTFIYVALANVMPQLMNEKTSVMQLIAECLAMMAGVGLMVLIAEFE